MVDYCTLEQFKVALGIDPTLTEFDAELTAIRTKQEMIINNELLLYTTVPLSTVPQSVEDCCVELCRVDYRARYAEDQDSLNVLRHLRNIAIKDLRRYIEVTYLDDIGIVVKQTRTDYE